MHVKIKFIHDIFVFIKTWILYDNYSIQLYYFMELLALRVILIQFGFHIGFYIEITENVHQIKELRNPEI